MNVLWNTLSSGSSRFDIPNIPQQQQQQVHVHIQNPVYQQVQVLMPCYLGALFLSGFREPLPRYPYTSWKVWKSFEFQA